MTKVLFEPAVMFFLRHVIYFQFGHGFFNCYFFGKQTINNCRTQLANLRLSDFFHKTRPRYTILGCDFNYGDCKNNWNFVVSQLFPILKLE